MIRRPPSPIYSRDINRLRERQARTEYERRIESYLSEARMQLNRIYRRENEINREIGNVIRLSKFLNSVLISFDLNHENVKYLLNHDQ